jgi:hypothetical protein
MEEIKILNIGDLLGVVTVGMFMRFPFSLNQLIILAQRWLTEQTNRKNIFEVPFGLFEFGATSNTDTLVRRVRTTQSNVEHSVFLGIEIVDCWSNS